MRHAATLLTLRQWIAKCLVPQAAFSYLIRLFRNLPHRDPRELLSPHPGQNALAPFISEVPDWFREFMRVTADLTHVRDEAMPFAST